MNISHFHSNKTKALIGFCIVISVFIHFDASKVMSQEVSLQVEPDIVFVELDATNKEESVFYTLTNNSDHSQIVSFQLFSIKNVDKKTNRLIYQPISQLPEVQQSFYENAISFFIEGKKSYEVTLAPKQTITVEAKISPPSDQSVSEYNMTIGFLAKTTQSVSEDQTENIEATLDIQAGVGSHLLVSLEDKPSHITLTNFHTQNSGSGIPDLRFILANRTNNTEQIYGNISIDNMLGVEIGSLDTENIYLLGNEEKTISIPSSDFRKIALHTVSIGLNTIKIYLFNSSGESVYTTTYQFWYIPVKGFVIALVIIVVMIVLVKKVKSKNLSSI